MSSRTVIASQLGEALDRQLSERFPGLDIRSVPPGSHLDALPHDARGLIHVPRPPDAGETPAERPRDWPRGLEFIQLITTGIDNYPAWLLRDVPVANCAGKAGGPLAEYAIAAVLAVAKGFHEHRVTVAAGWNRAPIAELRGSTLGIFGFGATGLELAKLAKAFGMNVLAMRRSAAPPEIAGVELVHEITDLLQGSDHLVLAAPATPDTFRIVNRTTLAKTKPGIHLINLARGSLIDNEALLEALEAGTVAWATLDTTEPEPLPDDHPLLSHPKVFITPHNANAVPAFFDRVLDRCFENLEHYLAGRQLVSLIDPDLGY